MHWLHSYEQKAKFRNPFFKFEQKPYLLATYPKLLFILCLLEVVGLNICIFVKVKVGEYRDISNFEDLDTAYKSKYVPIIYGAQYIYIPM